MQEKTTWSLPEHTLRFPIQTDAGELTTIPLRAFSVAEHRKALAEVGKDEDDQFEALLRLASGLSEEVLDQVKRPDYVSMAEKIYEYISLPASYFLESVPKDPDDAPLLVPIKGVGRMIERLQLQVPSLKVSKVMRKLKTDAERADFCSANCTGLSVPEIQSMAVPDWTQLQARLNDFLNKPADFFQ
ncbi:MAG: phage tail assembly protein [Afipia sp.]